MPILQENQSMLTDMKALADELRKVNQELGLAIKQLGQLRTEMTAEYEELDHDELVSGEIAVPMSADKKVAYEKALSTARTAKYRLEELLGGLD